MLCGFLIRFESRKLKSQLSLSIRKLLLLFCQDWGMIWGSAKHVGEENVPETAPSQELSGPSQREGRGVSRPHPQYSWDFPEEIPDHEDRNGEKLTVKKWWIFGAEFFTVWCRFFHGLRRFFTACKGHKR